MTGERVERLRRNHRDEIDSAALYDAMASAEREERLAGVYRSLADAETPARRSLSPPPRSPSRSAASSASRVT